MATRASGSGRITVEKVPRQAVTGGAGVFALSLIFIFLILAPAVRAGRCRLACWLASRSLCAPRSTSDRALPSTPRISRRLFERCNRWLGPSSVPAI